MKKFSAQITIELVLFFLGAMILHVHSNNHNGVSAENESKDDLLDEIGMNL